MDGSPLIPDWSRYRKAIAGSAPLRLQGRVVQVVGLIVEGSGPAASSISAASKEAGSEVSK